jgi:DNA repair protein RadC
MAGSAHGLRRASKNRDGHRRRLRVRFDRGGFGAFLPHERLELLLTLAIPSRDVEAQASALMSKFGSLRGVLDAAPDDLKSVPGVGVATPTILKIIREAAALYLQEGIEGRNVMDSPSALEDFWRTRLNGLDHEVFEVAHLDSRLRLLRDGVQTLQHGTVDCVLLYPRMVLEAALRRGTSAVVLAHNHPAGDPTPSQADIDITRALSLASATVQIRLVDHLVIGSDSVFSMRSAQLL